MLEYSSVYEDVVLVWMVVHGSFLYLLHHVTVKLVCKYPPYHCVLYEDNEVTWCPVLNINKTRSTAAEDSYSIL